MDHEATRPNPSPGAPRPPVEPPPWVAGLPGRDDGTGPLAPGAALVDEPAPAALGRTAGALLRDRRRRILRLWASQAGALPAFRARPGLTLDEVLGGIPGLIDAIAAGLEAAPVAEPPTSASAAAVAHGAARAAIGLTAADVVAEVRVLRQSLWRDLVTGLLDLAVSGEPAAPPDDVLALRVAIDDRLDRLLAEAIDALDHARP